VQKAPDLGAYVKCYGPAVYLIGIDDELAGIWREMKRWSKTSTLAALVENWPSSDSRHGWSVTELLLANSKR